MCLLLLWSVWASKLMVLCLVGRCWMNGPSSAQTEPSSCCRGRLAGAGERGAITKSWAEQQREETRRNRKDVEGCEGALVQLHLGSAPATTTGASWHSETLPSGLHPYRRLIRQEEIKHVLSGAIL